MSGYEFAAAALILLMAGLALYEFAVHGGLLSGAQHPHVPAWLPLVVGVPTLGLLVLAGRRRRAAP